MTSITSRFAVAFVSTSVLLVSGACSSATGIDLPASGFNATVRGAVTTSLVGSASISSPDQGVATGLTLPVGTAGTAILLVDSGHNHFISLVREGGLSVGTYSLHGHVGPNDGASTPVLYASYAQLQSADMQSFLADSGSVTITSVGNTIRGTFTLFASTFDVWPPLTLPLQVGSIVTPSQHGLSPLQITGSFEAAVH
jgi:hypothetical protein